MDKEIKEEIERLCFELSEANKRITTLEQELREQPVLSPSGPPVEQRALELLQYMEKHGRITSKQAKKILKCHHSGVLRAMHKLNEMYEEVHIKATSPMLILETNTALRTLRSGAQVELRSTW